MIGQIVSAIGGLATSYIDGKTAIQKANAEIKLKQATGEMDWEQAAISASNNSFKDELWTIVLFASLLLISCLLYKKLWHEDLPTLRLPPLGTDRHVCVHCRLVRNKNGKGIRR